eukprot:TRINITY_DN15709_c0_g1_i1.p1 TRINITY_DN15709_c0_g1~~TRINITY_DN15709_c0_g1_i1.p1  ORF type:complete len:106 (-),score=12.77 TRINITY_DN15709_c0_g1_i1:39-326(-)
MSVQASLAQAKKTEFQMRQGFVANTFGMHMIMREAMEEAILSQPRRLPGLVSTTSGLDTLRGSDEMLEWSDLHNDPALSEHMVDVHSAMERRRNM